MNGSLSQLRRRGDGRVAHSHAVAPGQDSGPQADGGTEGGVAEQHDAEEPRCISAAQREGAESPGWIHDQRRQEGRPASHQVRSDHVGREALSTEPACCDEESVHGERREYADRDTLRDHPRESVAALVRNRGIPSLMGDYDRGIGLSTRACGCGYKTDEQRREGAVSLEWTDAATTDETRACLRTLEDRFVLETPAGELLAVHGSPRRINEYLFEDRPEKAMARMTADNPCRAILFGHTHIPYAREVQHGGASTLFINVGSGGRPKDGDLRVRYALIDAAALAGGRPAAEFVRVPYDHEQLLAAIAETDLITRFDAPPQAADLDRPLRTEVPWRQ